MARKTLNEIREYAIRRRWGITITRRMIERRRKQLTGADLRDADLTGATLRGADLRDADLTGATLRGADLRDADLTGATLRDAALRDADLTGATLRDADLRGATLTGAILADADLRGADLRGAILRYANLRGAILPEGFHIFQMGPIGSRRDYVEFRNDSGTITVRAGCFSGTPEAFIAAVAEKPADDPHRIAYETIVIPALREWLAQFEAVE